MFGCLCLGTSDLQRSIRFYLRPQYQPDFYAAYVRDPAGHKLAAVCRGFNARENL